MHVPPQRLRELRARRLADAGEALQHDVARAALGRREELLVDAQVAVVQLGPAEVALG